MTTPTRCAPPSLERVALDALLAPEVPGPDGLHLASVAFVPEVRLYLADDPIILWARMEAEAAAAMARPFWASAWAGGQAVARYVLDHPDLVRGRRVLDLASGSGLVAIAAARAGAAAVTANDIDPYALVAITLNALANGVYINESRRDLLDSDDADDADEAEVVLAGDVFYNKSMAARVLPFLERAAARGACVLIGDPGRAYLPHDWLEIVATYRVSMMGAPEDAEITQTHVLRPRSEHEASRLVVGDRFVAGPGCTAPPTSPARVC